MTNFSFGRTDGWTERGNNNIPELSLESAGIISVWLTQTPGYTRGGIGYVKGVSKHFLLIGRICREPIVLVWLTH